MFLELAILYVIIFLLSKQPMPKLPSQGKHMYTDLAEVCNCLRKILDCPKLIIEHNLSITPFSILAVLP